MTRFAFVADVHVGNHAKCAGKIEAGINTRCRLVLEALERAVHVARDMEVDAFVVAGDLFDTARPPPQMVREAQRIIEQVPAIVLVGNHDRVSDAAGDHALGPMLPVADVIEYAETIVFDDWALICIPFIPGNAKEWFPEVVAERCQEPLTSTRKKLITFHLGVEDEKTEHFLRGAHDSVTKDMVEQVMEENDITYAFAGNWHDHRHWYVRDGKCGIVQVGTLAPTGWDNDGTDGYGTVAIFDSEKTPHVSFVEVPGPRFVKVRGPSAVDTFIAHAKKEGHSVFVKWMATLDNIREAHEELEEWTAAGEIVGWDVAVDDDRAEQAAKESAKVARKAQTLGEALAKFVEAMPLEEGVDRAWVLEKAQSYLGGAS